MEQKAHEQDQNLIEEPVSSEEIYHGKVIHLFKDTVRLPNGKNAIREVMRHIGAAAVVALTENEEVILVRQYRYPFGTTLLEIPAGKLDPGEAPERCARRELEEETGRSAAELFCEAGLPLVRAPAARVSGWLALLELLRDRPDGTPRLRVCDSCVNLIRTLPALQRDPADPNDCARTPHELTHAPDALHALHARAGARL